MKKEIEIVEATAVNEEVMEETMEKKSIVTGVKNLIKAHGVKVVVVAATATLSYFIGHARGVKSCTDTIVPIDYEVVTDAVTDVVEF